MTDFTPTPGEIRAARLSLTRDAWDDALLRGDLEAADRYDAEVQRLEAACEHRGGHINSRNEMICDECGQNVGTA